MTIIGADEDETLTRQAQIDSQQNLIEIAFGSIAATFTDVGAGPIDTANSIEVWNDTDAIMYLNFTGGSDAQIVIPEYAAKSFPVVTGSTKLYLKYAAAPTVGNLYIEIRH